MLILPLALLVADPDRRAFPEQVPAMMEECLTAAVAANEVSATTESYKYICAGEEAGRLWTFLETARLQTFEQDTPEGRWLGREFPLGGCFKRISYPDGRRASDGLSCTIWVPRPVISAPDDKH